MWLKQGCPHGDVLVLFQIAPETPTPGVRVARPKLGPATSLLARENRPQKPPTLPPPVVSMGNELVVDAGSRSLDVSRRSNFDVAEATSQVKLLLPKFHEQTAHCDHKPDGVGRQPLMDTYTERPSKMLCHSKRTWTAPCSCIRRSTTDRAFSLCASRFRSVDPKKPLRAAPLAALLSPSAGRRRPRGVGEMRIDARREYVRSRREPSDKLR